MTGFIDLRQIANVYEYFPQKTWEPAPEGFVPDEYTSVFPPLRKLPDGRLIVDQCGSQVAVFDNEDHPDLARLPKGTPRLVKAIMRRENRLRYLRAVDDSHCMDFEAAHVALIEWRRRHGRSGTAA